MIMHYSAKFHFVSLIVVLLTLHTANAEDVIERRGAQPALSGTVTIINDNGITIRSNTDAIQTIAWDRVRNVLLDYQNPDLPARLETAELLWRARSRLERGDSTLAEPLFERLFETYRGQTHETSLVVAEGLLRCRLARMANESAMIPALEVIRLRHKNIQSASYSMLPDIFDEDTGLCTALPPVWSNERALRVLERELASYVTGGDQVLADIAGQYQRAARQQLKLPLDSDESAEPTSSESVQHEAVKLLAMIIDVHDQDRTKSIAARRRLAARLDTLDTNWARAWARYALGSSMVNDQKLDARLNGLVHLMYLPAAGRFRDQQYLAGLALQTAAEVLDKMEDSRGAQELRADLRSRYPGHPANNTNNQYAHRTH